MNFKSNLQNEQHKGIRSKPLLSRVDHLRASRSVGTIDAAKGSSWNARLFARMICDSNLSVQQKKLIRIELDKFGFGVLERQTPALGRPAISDIGHGNAASHYSKQCTLVIFPDEPIDVESLAAAKAIELQMIGVPFETLPTSRIARWAPCMPIEISTVEQLAKKINAIRTIVNGQCQIGAAISPASVYEDVRAMADCGVDYVCLLVDVFPELSSNARIKLGSIDDHLEQAMKGLCDSGTSAQLHVSSNATTAEQMFGLFQAGVEAVSVDSCLAHFRPPEVAVPKDRYGSVLSYTPVPVSPFAWVAPAVNSLLQDLADWNVFSGENAAKG